AHPPQGDAPGRRPPPSARQTPRPAEPSASVVQAHGAQGAGPVNEKQIHAMERLAQQQGLDLDMESRRRFGVVAHGLTYDQASSLLRDLQRPANGKRAVNESAL